MKKSPLKFMWNKVKVAPWIARTLGVTLRVVRKWRHLLKKRYPIQSKMGATRQREP